MDTQNDFLRKLCTKLKETEKILELSTPKGEVGGYKLVNDSKNADTAYTKWYDANGKVIARVSPTTKISQKGMEEIQGLETKYSEQKYVFCSNK